MKRLVAAAVFVLALLPSIASAAPQCMGVGTNLVSCSGYTDAQFVSGHYVFTMDGFVWVNGYEAMPQYVAYECSRLGNTWDCTQSMPSYSHWTVNAQ